MIGYCELLDLRPQAPLLAGAAHVRLERNRMGRDFFVGDLHGQFDMLHRLLTHVGWNSPADRLIGVGDLLDRGPKGAELLDLVSEGKLHSVLGNHEAMYIAGDPSGLPPDLTRRKSLPDRDHDHYLAVARHMPLTMEIELSDGRIVGVVHAEVRHEDWAALRRAVPQMADASPTREGTVSDALWARRRDAALSRNRRPDGHSIISGVDLVICGHSGFPGEVTRYGNQISLESLAFLSMGAMTLFEPVSNRYWRLWNPKERPDLAVEEVAPPEDYSLHPELFS
jgi:serine/threonine protein phosphatase 1